MRKLADWLRGWATTLCIMVFERDTYRHLREEGFDLDEYVEIGPPEEQA